MAKDFEEGTSTGIWIGQGDGELFERFEEYFERTSRGEYKRSQRIKEAMEIYLVVHETIRADEGLPDPEDVSMREFKDMVRSELKFDDSV